MLIEFKPSLSIEQVMRRLKQLTLHDLWLKDGAYLKRFYWSSNHHLWTNGYFCSTIGDVSEETVRRYIENQG
jgi:putative transposase